MEEKKFSLLMFFFPLCNYHRKFRKRTPLLLKVELMPC